MEQEPVRRARIVGDSFLADGLRERSGVALHALRVRAGACVLALERARERRHRLQVRTLQQLPLSPFELEQMAEVAGVEEQLFLRAAGAFSRSTERHSVQAARQALGHGQQLERAERLPHERVGSDTLRGRARAAGRAGEQDDRDVAGLRVGLELRAQLEPGRAGHVHVEHDHVRPCGTNAPARRFGAVSFNDIDVRDFERRPQQRPETGIVVDQQDAQDSRPPFPVSGPDFRQRSLWA